MIKIIAAVDLNGGIGHDGKIPWYHPEDLKRFKEFTMNKNVIMGRKTYDSLPVTKLPGRTKFILTRHPLLDGDSTFWFSDLKELNLSRDYWVIGGGEIYKLFLDSGLVDEVDLTIVTTGGWIGEGGVFFPSLPSNFKMVSEEVNPKDPALLHRRFIK